MILELEAANRKIANVETEVKKLQNEKNHLNNLCTCVHLGLETANKDIANLKKNINTLKIKKREQKAGKCSTV